MNKGHLALSVAVCDPVLTYAHCGSDLPLLVKHEEKEIKDAALCIQLSKELPGLDASPTFLRFEQNVFPRGQFQDIHEYLHGREGRKALFLALCLDKSPMSSMAKQVADTYRLDRKAISFFNNYVSMEPKEMGKTIISTLRVVTVRNVEQYEEKKKEKKQEEQQEEMVTPRIEVLESSLDESMIHNVISRTDGFNILTPHEKVAHQMILSAFGQQLEKSILLSNEEKHAIAKYYGSKLTNEIIEGNACLKEAQRELKAKTGSELLSSLLTIYKTKPQEWEDFLKKYSEIDVLAACLPQ